MWWRWWLTWPFTQGPWEPMHLIEASAVVLLAQTSSTMDPIAQFTGYGALGGVVIGAIFGLVRFKPEVTGLREDMQAQAASHTVERDRMQNQIDTLLEVHRTQVLPALLTSAEALRSSTDQVQRMATQLSLLTDTLRERR